MAVSRRLAITGVASAASARRSARAAGVVTLLLVVGYLVLWPLIQLQILAFEDRGAGIRDVIDQPGIGTTLKNTLVVGFGSGGLAVLLGTSLAWATTRLTRRVRRVASLMPLLPLIIPSAATVVGWAFLFSPRVGYINRGLRTTPLFDHLTSGPIDVYSMKGIVIVQTFTLTSFVYIFLETGLRNMGQDYEKAAAASGASEFRTFFTVTLPLLRPSIMYASTVAFLLGLGSFTVPLFLGANGGIAVLTTEIYHAKETFPIDYGYTAALALPLLIVGVIIVVAQRFVVGDQRRFVVSPGRTQYPDRARSSRLAAAFLMLYGSLATFLPLAALVHVSFHKFWTGRLTFDGLTVKHYEDVLFESASIRNSIMTSGRATFTTLLIVLPLGYFCARVLQRVDGGRLTRRAIDAIVNLPLGVPATLFGLGLLYTYTKPPLILYGTTSVLVVTYVALMMPHATRLQLATQISVGNEGSEASAASGAGPLRTFFRVTLPMTRKGIGAAATLIVILLMSEFSASIMVRSPRSQVLGTVIWDVWLNGVYPAVAVIALLTVAVTVIGIVLAGLIGGRDALGSL